MLKKTDVPLIFAIVATFLVLAASVSNPNYALQQAVQVDEHNAKTHDPDHPGRATAAPSTPEARASYSEEYQCHNAVCRTLVGIWVFIVSSVTIPANLFSLAVAAFTWLLYDATKRLWEAGEKQIAVAQKSADAALLTAEASIGVEIPRVIQSRIYIRQPLMTLGLFGAGGPQPDWSLEELVAKGDMVIEFKNVGRTAAEVVGISFNTLLANELPDEPQYGDVAPIAPAQTFEGNGASWTHYVFKWDRPQIPKQPANFLASILIGDSLWAYGYLIYLDFMGAVTEEKFCGRLLIGSISGEATFWRAGPASYFGKRRTQTKEAK